MIHNILIVDDDERNVHLLSSLLTGFGYGVLKASNGRVALRIAETKFPALILLDIMMSEMDGYEVCLRLKKERKTRDIPVIFLSALHETANKVKGFKLGAVDYLTKPFQQEEVLARVKMHVTMHHLQQELEGVNRKLEERVKDRTRELKKNNRALKTLNACNDILIHAETEENLVEEICNIIIEKGDYALAWVGYAENDRKKTVRPAVSSGKVEYLKTIEVTWSDTALGRGPAGTAIRSGEISVVKEVNGDQIFSPGAEKAESFGLRSVIGLPFIINDTAFASLTIYSSEPDAFDPEEIKLLEKLADNISYGIRALRTEKERTEVERKLRSLEKALETTTMGVTITDKKGEILYTNPAEAEMHGYNIKDLVGQSSAVFAQPDKRRFLTVVADLSDKTRKRESINIRKDGSEFPVYLVSDAVKDVTDNIVGFVTTCEDITERKIVENELKRSREELRKLIERVENVREEERKRIARDIHDELGQILTVFSFDLSWIAKRVNKKEKEILEKIAKTSELIDSAIENVQKISSELRPTVLDNLGLVAGMEWQSMSFEERTGIKCNLLLDSEIMLPDEQMSTEIFRIFQEALTNVARHSGATKVDITLKKQDNEWLDLTVKDNGRGISKEEIRDSNSIGLIGIRERIRHWDGKMGIKGEKGRGTTVNIKIPID